MRLYKILIPSLAAGFLFVSACKKTLTMTVGKDEVGFVLRHETYFGCGVSGCNPGTYISNAWVESGPYPAGTHQVDVARDNDSLSVTVRCGKVPFEDTLKKAGLFEVTEDGNAYHDHRPVFWYHVYVEMSGNAIVSCSDTAMLKGAALAQAYNHFGRDGRLDQAHAVLDAAIQRVMEEVIPGCVKDGLLGYSAECKDRIRTSLNDAVRASTAIDHGTFDIKIYPE